MGPTSRPPKTVTMEFTIKLTDITAGLPQKIYPIAKWRLFGQKILSNQNGTSLTSYVFSDEAFFSIVIAAATASMSLLSWDSLPF